MKHTHSEPAQLKCIVAGKSFTVANQKRRQDILDGVRVLRKFGVIEERITTLRIEDGKPEFEVFVSRK